MSIVINPLAPPVTPPDTITGADGVLTAVLDTTWAGVALTADFSDLVPLPVKVRFLRVDDTPVRGGNDAFAPGGRASAYEHEAGLGVTTSWYAVPVYKDGSLGNPSLSAGLLVPAPTGRPSNPGCWIKSIEIPSNSTQCMINSWPSTNYEVFSSVDHVPGRQLSIGTFDSIGGFNTSVKLVTTDATQFQRMHDCLAEGVILIQPAPKFNKPQGFCMVESITVDDIGTMQNPVKIWTIGITEVDRPETLGQPSRMPGHSFDDRLARYPYFNNVPPGNTYESNLVVS